ncbi:MAG: AraC family transcriptional regulator [Pseudomonadota bacterium]
MTQHFVEDIARISAATQKNPAVVAPPGGAEALGMALWVWDSGDEAAQHTAHHHRIAFEVPREGASEGGTGLEAAIRQHGCRRVAITPAGMSHGWRMENDAVALGLYLDPQHLNALAAKELGQTAPFTIERSTAFDAELLGFLQIAAAQDGPLLGPNAIMREAMTEALCTTLIHVHAPLVANREPLPPAMRDPRLQRVVTFIERRLDRQLRVSDLAEVAAMSQFHLMRQFRAESGRTLGQYVLERRICRATMLLERSDLALVEIAVACGFSSQGHFSARFRQVTGKAPADFRRGIARRRKDSQAPMPL